MLESGNFRIDDRMAQESIFWSLFKCKAISIYVYVVCCMLLDLGVSIMKLKNFPKINLIEITINSQMKTSYYFFKNNQ